MNYFFYNFEEIYNSPAFAFWRLGFESMQTIRSQFISDRNPVLRKY